MLLFYFLLKIYENIGVKEIYQRYSESVTQFFYCDHARILAFSVQYIFDT